MKPMLLALTFLLLVAGPARAALVEYPFSGTLSSYDDYGQDLGFAEGDAFTASLTVDTANLHPSFGTPNITSLSWTLENGTSTWSYADFSGLAYGVDDFVETLYLTGPGGAYIYASAGGSVETLYLNPTSFEWEANEYVAGSTGLDFVATGTTSTVPVPGAAFLLGSGLLGLAGGRLPFRRTTGKETCFREVKKAF